MAKLSRGKSERSDWFFLGRDFADGPFPRNGHKLPVYVLFSKARKFKTSMARVPYN